MSLCQFISGQQASIQDDEIVAGVVTADLVQATSVQVGAQGVETALITNNAPVLIESTATNGSDVLQLANATAGQDVGLIMTATPAVGNPAAYRWIVGAATGGGITQGNLHLYSYTNSPVQIQQIVSVDPNGIWSFRDANQQGQVQINGGASASPAVAIPGLTGSSRVMLSVSGNALGGGAPDATATSFAADLTTTPGSLIVRANANATNNTFVNWFVAAL